MIGTKLAHYEITSHLGSGGMGDVYQATDSKLGRSVAVKFLPEVFTHDNDRSARFEREARVLASLNHPHIAAIYGIEEANQRKFLVMELVPGDTLAERIKRGPIPVDEALNIAKSICDSLEAAHEKGIVHRDLKPSNVKITPQGNVKVLDFGLAKVREAEQPRSSLSNSPTLLSNSIPGTIMGTAAYMSPEQAKGREVDRRTDIFAFGAVLYEMLTGRAAFEGEDVQDILGAVLKSEPDWTRLPSPTPASIHNLLRLCLEKDLKKRRRDAGDVRIDIEQAQSETLAAASVLPAAARIHNRLWLGLTGVLLIAIATLALMHLGESTTGGPSIRFALLPPAKATLGNTPPAISPDGRRIAFAATLDGKTQLWVRPLGSLSAQPLSGTDSADLPFWSPDSRSLAFFADGKLKKIDASGGSPQTLCDAPLSRGGSWNRDGVIIFSPNANGPVHRVSSSGGASSAITDVSPEGEVGHRYPVFLPDGRHFLFLAIGGEKPGIYMGALDSKDRRRLLEGTSAGAYAPPGYILFVREGSVMAQRLDLKSFQLAGEAFPIAEAVGLVNGNVGIFSVSDNEVLVYAGAGSVRQLAWFDRAGKLVERIGPSLNMQDLALSPDQKRAAVQLISDIWIVDLMRGVLSRLTFNPVVSDYPVWSPDGRQILFNSGRSGQAIYQKTASGAAADELLFKSNTTNEPTDWSRDGRFILYDSVDPKTFNDIWLLPLSGDRKPEIFLQTPFAELQARFSPEAKWIAYASNESGPFQVYVQSFPPSGGKWQISTNGGLQPRWRADGKELFYMALDRKIMAVDVKARGASFEVSSPKVLFDAPIDIVAPNAANRYDVRPDGQRFLVNAPVESSDTGPITVILNWLADAKN
jgi:eukaryotic-like serine/threonine-protein kinase